MNKFKRQLTIIYNNINQELFSAGVQSLHITVMGNKVIILAEHHRIPSLKALDECYREKTKEIDVLLGEIFKERLKVELQQQLSVDAQHIFRDYDHLDEMVATLIVLKENI
mgnify:CR=1 FL=1